MLELVKGSGEEPAEIAHPEGEADPRPSATIHYIYNPFSPSVINAIASVAKRLQEALIEYGALPDGAPLPFPYLASSKSD